MKLASLLEKKFIKINHNVSSTEDVVRDLVREICSRQFSREFGNNVVRLIMEREALSPTVEAGISIPHARIEGFKDLIIGISIPKNPIMVGEEEVKIFFLILTAKTSSRLYLNTLSAIARIAKNRELLERIIFSKDEGEIIRIISNADIKVKEELTVSDIMDKEFSTISPSATLKDAIDLLYKTDRLFAFVVDNDRLVGELRFLDIVKKGVPHYVKSLVNIKFLRDFEPLESLLKDEDKIKVSEIASPVSKILSPESSIVEVIVEMVKEDRFYLPVVKDDKLIGIVTLKEFITHILRA